MDGEIGIRLELSQSKLVLKLRLSLGKTYAEGRCGQIILISECYLDDIIDNIKIVGYR